MPEGVLVTGYRDGRPWIERCIDHIYITHEPVKNTKWQSGYQQGATCLVCDIEVYPMDASWWLEEPTTAQLRKAGILIRIRIEHLQGAYDLFRHTFKQKRKT